MDIRSQSLIVYQFNPEAQRHRVYINPASVFSASPGLSVERAQIALRLTPVTAALTVV